MISIAGAEYALQVLPEVGGAIAALRFQGSDILRPAPSAADEPFETAAFPLVPFANRIARGAFRFGGTQVRLEPNAPGQAHALHGHGWRVPWRVESAQAGRLAMTFEHPAGEWPWHYVAHQLLSLDEQGLEVALSIENRSDRPMPVGFGWHPYFLRSPGLRLRTRVEGVWLTDEQCLPRRRAPAAQFGDWRRGERLPAGAGIDHCYCGWNGEARIEWPERMLCLTLTASEPLRWLHLYAPPGKRYFCVEPVSHMPDAVNRAEPAAVTGHRTLAPGARLAAAVRLRAAPLP